MDKYNTVLQRKLALIEYVEKLSNTPMDNSLLIHGNCAPVYSSRDKSLNYYSKLVELRNSYEEELLKILTEQIEIDKDTLKAVDELLVAVDELLVNID
jgi:hypothetical protein